MPQRWAHKYVSTYCQHGQHDDCRLGCKVCKAPCLCPCHRPPLELEQRLLAERNDDPYGA